MIDSSLPGAELVETGLDDLANNVVSIESLLVSMTSRRLQELGHHVPAPIADAELRLYQLLAAQYGDAAHGRYNALVRRLSSYQRAAACAR